MFLIKAKNIKNKNIFVLGVPKVLSEVIKKMLQPKVGKSQEILGMGRLKFFLSTGQKTVMGGGCGFHPSPVLIGLTVPYKNTHTFDFACILKQSDQQKPRIMCDVCLL